MGRLRITLQRVFIGALGFVGLPACGGISIKVDGPLATYMEQPLPRPKRALAQTFSLEKVAINTAGSDKPVVSSDLIGPGLYTMPSGVTDEVLKELDLQGPFSKEKTLAAINVLARNRARARGASNLRRAKNAPTELAPGTPTGDSSRGAPAPVMPTGTSAPSNTYATQYIAKQEQQASAARRQGDHMKANIHSSAAANMQQVSRSMDSAVASAQALSSGLAAAHQAGVQLYQAEFADMRNWITNESGAIGPDAPAGTHMSVFMLEFMQAKSFRFDSWLRAAIVIVLVDEDGETTTIVEGSDILTCVGSCNAVKPKPTARSLNPAAYSDDVRADLGSMEAIKARQADGFRTTGGIYQYVHFRNALAHLAEARPPITPTTDPDAAPQARD